MQVAVFLTEGRLIYDTIYPSLFKIPSTSESRLLPPALAIDLVLSGS